MACKVDSLVPGLQGVYRGGMEKKQSQELSNALIACAEVKRIRIRGAMRDTVSSRAFLSTETLGWCANGFWARKMSMLYVGMFESCIGT